MGHRTRERWWGALLSGVFMAGCYTGLDGSARGDAADDGDDGGSAGDDDDGGGVDDGVSAEFEPAPARLRLLLSRQYRHAVRDLLGEDAGLAATPPPDVSINGFDAVGAGQLALTDAHVDAYETSARAIADVAILDDAILGRYHDCVPTGPSDEACLTEFVTRFGRLAFRRSLDAEETATYVAVALGAAEDLGDFDAGLTSAIATLLQSPNFLYQVEIGEPTDLEGVRRLTPSELATRMAFFLLDSTPDAELLDLAEAGMLDDAEGIRDAAADLLARSDARQALADFTAEVWRLRELATVPKDPAVYPAFGTALAQAMQEETLALVAHVSWDAPSDFRDVFDAPYTFVDAQLAAHYGLPQPEQYGESFTQTVLPPEQLRGGMFGHAGLLSLLAHISSTSPTYRGKFVREKLLCQVIPAPPNDVDTTLPPPGEYTTMRERLEQHMEDPSCSGCHLLMDPVGLGLENYDGIGQFRTMENGATIDASAELDGEAFAGAAELGALLKEHPNVPSCLVRNLFRHATGHIEGPGEADEIEEIVVAFAEGDYRMQGLLVELVASPAFRLVGNPE
jgi:hypothetical protein